MRLLMLGGNGATGRELVTQALSRGHDVRALVRTPPPPDAPPGVDWVQGDAREVGTLTGALSGRDALISVIGARGLGHLRPVTVHAETAPTIVQAMRHAGVSRFLGVTSAGLEHSDPAFDPLYRLLFQGLLLHRVYADMRHLETAMLSSDLDWTVVRAPFLTGTDDGPYRVSARGLPPGGRTLARAQLARFLLDALEEHAWLRATPTPAR